MSSARAPSFIARLRSGLRGRVAESEPLARHSTFRIGGPATLVTPADAEDLATTLRLAAEAAVPVFLLGLGSNVLFPDDGLEALAVKLGKGLDQLHGEGARWTLGAGLPAPLAARRTADTGWAGLHMMVGVPGTVGGGVYMNAGCHGGQWADVVREVLVLDRAGTDRSIPGSAIPFAYRRSGLDDLIVVRTTVELQPGDPEELAEQTRRLFAWRQQGTPFNQPCCGSVFKNPAGPSGTERRTAGQLLEAAGLKRTRVGALEVSLLHANYIVNLGEGRAEDARRLMDLMVSRVVEEAGIRLEPEVKLIAPSGDLIRC